MVTACMARASTLATSIKPTDAPETSAANNDEKLLARSHRHNRINARAPAGTSASLGMEERNTAAGPARYYGNASDS